MPPQTNATLTRVQAATAGETFDGPPAPGAEKWAAPAGQTPNAYLLDKRRRVQQTGGTDVVIETTLIVEAAAPAVDWRIGDVVTFTRSGAAVAETREVDTVQRSAIDDPDIPPDLITIALVLKPE